ncbi:hypothetical protein EN786_12370 [Mesorhizobium sp. M4B.F.Ca.ET.143.01.1.1]|nr:hypothetical protein EN786_12370 [Mesorhizobium sp. M4B.F.Ca.ET.143.01.1.1]
MIEALDLQLPGDMPLSDRKKLIQAEAWRFHGGTSWGQKVWPKAKRAYFGKKYGDRPAVKAGVPEGHLSPLERLMAKSAIRQDRPA